jgi:hypothetical protein
MSRRPKVEVKRTNRCDAADDGHNDGGNGRNDGLDGAGDSRDDRALEKK